MENTVKLKVSPRLKKTEKKQRRREQWLDIILKNLERFITWASGVAFPKCQRRQSRTPRPTQLGISFFLHAGFELA